MNRRLNLSPLLLFMVATAQAQRVGFSGNTCPESCPDFVQPVCGTNNRAYRNDCYLRLAACNSNIRKKNDGPCGGAAAGSQGGSSQAAAPERRECDRSCGTSYQPVCATNGVTYDNRCKLGIATCINSNIKERYEGVCPEPPNRESQPSGSRPVSTSSGNRVTIGQPVRPILTALQAAVNDRPNPPAPVAPAAAAPVAPTPPARNCDESRCTPGFRPVCGTDNQVYGNECLLRVAICRNPNLGKLNDGVCTKDCSVTCPLEINYVCGSNGRTYVNDCELLVAQCKDPAVRKVANKACDGFENPSCKVQNCERTGTPVCGSDGRTYQNLCVLSNRACFDSSLLRLHDGQCLGQRCRDSCPAIADPVCGTDGVTYPNHCLLINEACKARANVVKASDGPCRSNRG